jgi:hypothetical protein
MPTLYIHIADAEAFVGEVDELPNPSDQYILVRNPRLRDGKDLRFLLDDVTTMLIPWWRITYIEIMPTGEDEEEFFMPFRDDA